MAGALVSIEVDASSLRALYDKLSPELWREALEAALIDATHQMEAEVKQRTPVLTGNLRRSIQGDVTHARDDKPYVSVATEVVYAWPVEKREEMFGRSAEVMEAKLPRMLDNIAREVESRWGA